MNNECWALKCSVYKRIFYIKSHVHINFRKKMEKKGSCIIYIDNKAIL